VDPESNIEIPENLMLSSSFNVILLVPTLSCEDVTYCVDMVVTVNTPLTFKLPDIFTSLPIPTPPLTTNAPLVHVVLLVLLFIDCVPVNMLEPVVANTVESNPSSRFEFCAYEAVPRREPLTEPVNPAPINVIPLLDTSNDPVITALPEKGNPAPLPPPEPLNVPKNDPENEPE